MADKLNTEWQLDEYLRSSGKQRWRWGSVDCTMWVADWWCVRWGVDPAVEIRGTYSSEEAANRVTEKHGGLLGLACSTLPDDMKKAAATSVGDVGIIIAGAVPVCAIWTGSHWLYKVPPSGVAIISETDVLGVWGEKCQL